ncbi:uncharacterized protein BYT42DRAFT_609519 [Radiomyces spectabilis]|uniref:uncharacterized protein n=1 Tax=Radiomyces spectabilis TaxID=64574 RepID=UPI00221F01F3|nr:uncharacterized protein BYT42DRAFT_609519 [Radiomyces spectabilis]KAI8393750.1 hypothetical protein BYT42DRAFT_609519 [Radiomyces spectabilis]
MERWETAVAVDKKADDHASSIVSEVPTSDLKSNRQRLWARVCVFSMFIICVLGAVAAFFCWPRTPLVILGGRADNVAVTRWIPENTHATMRATWQVNVTLDNRENWIPTHITRLDFALMDSLTLKKFAFGSISSIVLPPRRLINLPVVFNIDYAPVLMGNDPTMQNLYNACGPQKAGAPSPALNVVLHVAFHIFGIIWVPTVAATPPTGGFLCPPS